MPTECSAERFDFGVVEGRAVEAAFDGGLVTSDAGALLLGATDRAIDLVGRFADCFRDHRRQDLIEHAVGTLIGQRVFGIALGYEDLNDHDELRHDPLMAVLAGKLTARRGDCAPVAGKLFGLARNARLVAMIEEELAAAKAAAEQTGRPARRFKEFQWSTLDSWSQQRRVVAKAEWTQG